MPDSFSHSPFHLDLGHLFKIPPQVPNYGTVDVPLEQFRLVAIAILAAQLEPEKMLSDNPAPAIRRAAQLLERLPEYLPFEKLSRVQEQALIRKRITEEQRLVGLWKMDKDRRFTLEQFVGTPDCKHKSLRGLKAMLKRVDFPFLEIPKKSSDVPSFWPAGEITLEAYQYALKLDAELREKRKLEKQRKRRARQV